ncbi:MAG: hypothetical protein DRJ05_06575 [Bacteroidetes bacterium]|nr:MAG: hypothetical protein DRJ05_06575 [Bacteroidota bacterium]
MKKRILPISLFLIFIVLAGFGSVFFSNGHRLDTLPGTPNVQSNVQAIKPASEYLATVRNNQLTGLINPVDVIRVQSQLKEQSSLRSTSLLDWKQSGPDNFGGRTRAIIYDNKDSEAKTLYAAAVSGGIWKSVNGGITWKKVNKANSNLFVSCMQQSPNGDIYVGTGESFAAEAFSGLEQMGYNGGFMGQGIFKSSDGDNFTLLGTTAPAINDDQSDWAYVNELALDNDKNRIYAATNTGLKFSNDDGVTWALAQDTAGTELVGNTFDVQIGSDGTVIAAVENLCYISTGAVDSFILRSTGDSISLPATSLGRTEFAIAPSDPNVIYASIANNIGDLKGVYKTEDKGTIWRVVMPASSTTELFHGQGVYDNAITVFPNDPNRVLLGGRSLWEGKQYSEDGFYSWQEVSEGFTDPLSPTYVHFDHHTYVFKPGSDNTFFIGTDGGVAEGTYSQSVYSFKTNNRSYFTTQFYTVAPSGFKDYILGGAQDNGTISIPGMGNTNEQGFEIFPADGGPCAVSLINPAIVLVSLPTNTDFKTPVFRSEDFGVNYSTPAQFLAGKVENESFRTPIALWESFDNENSRDSVKFYSRDTIYGGSIIQVISHNSGQPFYYTTPNNVTLYPGDSILTKDPVSSVLFIAVRDDIWMTWDLHQFNQVPEWFNISNPEFGFTGAPHSIAYSSDANHIFVGTEDGRLFRISNLALAYSIELADVSSPECIVSTQEIPLKVAGGDPMSQVVTSIAVDSENSNNIIVTLGNYGNEQYVLYSNNALAQVPDFESKQGNLPQMPVYSSVIEMSDGNVGIIGTEYGVYSTQNLKSSSPDWVADAQNMGSVPVFEIKQQTVSQEHMQVRLVNGDEVTIIDYLGTNNYGSIYAASYGRGLFRTDNYFLVGTEENEVDQSLVNAKELKLYPNPVSSMATVEMELNTNTKVDFYISDLSGRQLSAETRYLLKGINRIDFDMSGLQPGLYFIQAVSDGDIRVKKFIVK